MLGLKREMSFALGPQLGLQRGAPLLLGPQGGLHGPVGSLHVLGLPEGPGLAGAGGTEPIGEAVDASALAVLVLTETAEGALDRSVDHKAALSQAKGAIEEGFTGQGGHGGRSGTGLFLRAIPRLGGTPRQESTWAIHNSR
jgi:hypothetical protein